MTINCKNQCPGKKGDSTIMSLDTEATKEETCSRALGLPSPLAGTGPSIRSGAPKTDYICPNRERKMLTYLKLYNNAVILF